MDVAFNSHWPYQVHTDWAVFSLRFFAQYVKKNCFQLQALDALLLWVLMLLVFFCSVPFDQGKSPSWALSCIKLENKTARALHSGSKKISNQRSTISPYLLRDNSIWKWCYERITIFNFSNLNAKCSSLILKKKEMKETKICGKSLSSKVRY